MAGSSPSFHQVDEWRRQAVNLVRGRTGPFIAVNVALAVAFWFAMGATALFAHQVFDDIPDRQSLGRVAQMARSSVFYDFKDQPAFTIFKEQRLEVPLDQMSPNLKKAMLAIEDQRFYDHNGIDTIRITGAAIANLKEGRAAQGGSTITQQLARMSFLSTDKTYSRKLREVVLAALIETEYAKDQILELYLNKVYFGAGLYGAEAASLGYFGKRASKLTVSEAALLAGLVKAPSNYAPTVNMERALQRRNLVLHEMFNSDSIDKETYERAKAEKIVLVDALRKEEPYGRYFKEQVRRELIARFGEGRVYEGGLRVFTTIDLQAQRAADAEVQRVLADLERRRSRRAPSTQRLQAALVALDAQTGEVRALVGGRDFQASNFNRALQAKRQPGSAFKPFVYAAALEAGYTPATIIDRLDEPIDTVQGAWVPEDGHSTASAMTMRAALKTSSNRAAVRMLEDLGIRKAVDYAQRVGVGTMPSVPSLALGSGEVTLESLTSGFGVFAAGGVRRAPTYIRRVEDANGQVIFAAQELHERVISEQTAFLMTDMLSDVIDHGTGWKARQLGFRLPAAGKTGTTNDYKDAWFIGYTPRLVTGVWVGFDQPQTIMASGYAADVAVPLWAGFMRKATRDHESSWYKAPKGIVSASVCRLSGMRPVSACYGAMYVSDDGSVSSSSSIYNEYFVKGTEPTDTCPIHGGDSSIFSRVAGWVGGPLPEAVLPQGGVIIEPAQEIPEDARVEQAESREVPEIVQPRKKKRGFWSKVFGVGKDDDDKDDDDDDDDKKKKKKKKRDQ